MSILIHGIEMPKSCGNCFFDTRCDNWRLRNWGAPPPDDCPLVPVPPHGRLIDAEALERDIDKYIGGEEPRSRFHHWVQVQRTVIPESEEEHK